MVSDEAVCVIGWNGTCEVESTCFKRPGKASNEKKVAAPAMQRHDLLGVGMAYAVLGVGMGWRASPVRLMKSKKTFASKKLGKASAKKERCENPVIARV